MTSNGLYSMIVIITGSIIAISFAGFFFFTMWKKTEPLERRKDIQEALTKEFDEQNPTSKPK